MPPKRVKMAREPIGTSDLALARDSIDNRPNLK